MGVERTLTNWSRPKLSVVKLLLRMMSFRADYHKLIRADRFTANHPRRCFLGASISFNSAPVFNRLAVTQTKAYGSFDAADHLTRIQNWCEADYEVSR